MKNKNRAFSLIEMSIVILIVGILIAGATQGSRLVNASRLQTAQTMTESAPVTSISGLITWLEPVRTTSFLASETVDGGTITDWYNTNPQTYNSRIAAIDTAYTSAAATTYNLEGINNLPSIKFATAGTGFVGPVVPTSFAAYTVFVVYRVSALTAMDILYNGVSATNGFGLLSGATDGALDLDGITTDNDGSIAAIANAAQIGVFTISPDSVLGVSTAASVSSFINGTLDVSAESIGDAIVTPTGNLTVGAGGAGTAFTGDISEIIIYGKELNKQDRQSVEYYLGHKYAIEISAATT